ncbi:hypothetical protein [Deinococcus sp. QL22]|uniref:hypothetical protein n=1 Tax=Deinococcus sp. QL22 TaxID=2939437 RepID=UPI002016ECD8|nr:hypothetical protein [Deinococcus sp. QL22]UQN10357.1 hypothetical protein M1R55_29845 [Deinococcus sp. QL22]UQN10491.1 hypothetical protein M1R55_29170 [Deinococcus sp. QL22]
MTNPNDHPPLYKLVVQTHAGVFKHELVLDGILGLQPGQQALNLTDGPSLEVRPNGDCRQATFGGVGDQLNIGYEDVVDIFWSEDGGLTWRSRWAGYADTVAPRRDPEPHGYVLNGLRQRLDRVEARLPIAQAAPNQQFAQLMNDLIDSGQVGEALRRPPLPALGTGSQRARILPRYESVMEIAEKWLTGDLEDGSPGLGDYGVNAQRLPIWGPAEGLHVFDEQDGVLMNGKAGSSAKLRTHVRATWTKPGRGPYAVFGESLLADQEGVQTTALIQVADPAVYGYSSRREPLKPLASYFTRAPCTSVAARWTPGSGYTSTGRAIATSSASVVLRGVTVWAPALVDGGVDILNDASITTAVSVQTPEPTSGALPAQGGTFEIEATYAPSPVPWGVAAHAVGGIITGFIFDQVLDVRCPPPDDGGLLLFPDEVRQWITEHWDASLTSRVAVRIARTGTGPVHLTTLGALFLNEPAVKKAVQRLAHLPVQDPENIRVPGWNVEPRAWVTCIYRNSDGTEQGRTEARRADLYRYTIDEGGQQWTEVQVAQADEADELAFAAVLERQANRAAVQASMNSN